MPKKKPKMKLGFLIPVLAERLAQEDPALMNKMPKLKKAVESHLSSKKTTSSSGKSADNILKIRRRSDDKVTSETKVLKIRRLSSGNNSKNTDKLLSGSGESSQENEVVDFAISADSSVEENENRAIGEQPKALRSSSTLPSSSSSLQKEPFQLMVKLECWKSYEIELRKCQAVMPVDDHIFQIVFPDFDEKRSCLKMNKIILVERRCFFEDEKICWLYGCSCDPAELSFISTITSATGYNQVQCNHIKAITPLIEELESWDENEDPFDCHSTLFRGTDIAELSFDSGKILVLVNGSVGVVSFDGIKYMCCICLTPYCIHVTTLKQYRLKEDIPSFAAELFNTKYQSCCKSYYKKNDSWRKIPFTPDNRMQFCLRSHPLQYLELSSDPIAEFTCQDRDLLFCSTCSSELVVGESEVLSLFTSNASFKCEVLSKTCSSLVCFESFKYDGRNDAIFNMGDVLIHYSVLRDYLFHFLHGNSCTLHGYYDVWKASQESGGNKCFITQLNYSSFRFAWYAYLNLLDIDYAEDTNCKHCGNIPHQIVCDATSLGYQRKFAAIALQNTTSEERCYKRYSTHLPRIAIQKKSLRDQLGFWLQDKLSKPSKVNLLQDLRQHCRPVYIAFKWTIDCYGAMKIPQAIQDIFQCVSSASPVCAYLYPSDFAVRLAESMFEEGIKANIEVMKSIQRELPLFFNLLTCLQIESCLPGEWKGLVLLLCDKSQEPFKSTDVINTVSTTTSHEICSFPSLPVLRKRGKYEQDKENHKGDSCRKLYKGHPRLLPGIFTIYCPHGICYGYQVMESQESPNIPFTIFKTRFPKAPELVVYDNACSLHAYCLNRDPLYFKDTMFLVDRFHWKNHTACAVGYNMRKYNQFSQLNSEINEQQNAATKKLKTQLSYMSTQNFINHCNFFFWYRNFLKLEKM